MNKHFKINATTLKFIALGLMLVDHLWASVIPGNQWMTFVGRLAFPIFAFQIVEGYHHTSNVKNSQIAIATCPLFQNKSLSHL